MSAVGHGLVLAALLWAPRPEPAALPGVVTVDLVAMAPAAAAARPAARAPAPRPAEVPPAPTPVEAKPVPAPVEAKPEPPKPEAPKPEPPKPVPPPRAEVAIPKKPEREPERPKAKPEPKPSPPEPPKEVAKATPPKPPPPAPPKPAPPKQESYDDLLADLRAERGEAKPERVERPARAAGGATTPGPGAGRPGAAVSPEIAGWVRAVQIHVGQAWMLPTDMRGRRLMTELLVDLDAAGKVLSEPRVVRSSGDSRFDENAVRAIQKASPLPAPPDAGVWTIGFCPECRG